MMKSSRKLLLREVSVVKAISGKMVSGREEGAPGKVIVGLAADDGFLHHDLAQF